jgi:murein DD-endopeptidase MepM/ murein hydrolase activator NlpD
VKKWVWVVVIASLICAVFIIPPSTATANSELDKINRELRELKRQKAQAQAKARETQQQLRRIQAKKNETAKDIKTLLRQIDDSKVRMSTLQKQIKVIESDLEESFTRLEKAKLRVYEQDQMLKKRLRVLYMNGTVSYLEVILNAADFSQFLDRYSQLSSLIEQDKDLLAKTQSERDLVAQQRKKIQGQLASLNNKYFEVEDLKDSLQVQEVQKEQLIKEIVVKEERLEEVSEEQEQAVVELARKESALLREKNKYEFKYKGGKMSWPVPSVQRITSYFGYRSDPFSGRKKMHKGIDIGAPAGTAIIAAEQGVVVVASWNSGYGNTVIIDHGKDVQTWYAHIRNGGIKVRKGQQVNRGDKIAEVGTTGQSTGNHLHFEVRLNGTAVNPLGYVR